MKKLSTGAVLALLLLAVIGCSSSGKAGSSGSAGFNNADVTFAQAMTPTISKRWRWPTWH